MSNARHVTNVALGFVILLGVWQAIVIIGQYESALFPSPLKVGAGLMQMIQDGSIFVHLRVSVGRFLVGYLLAVTSAIVFGLILGRISALWGIIDPIAQVIRPISPIAWSPFIVLWFGIGDMPAIVVIFIAAFFPVLMTTVSAVKKVDETYLKVAQNFELNQLDLIRKIIFPAAFPTIANGLHIAVGTAWIFLVSGEMVGTQSGLGYLIIDSRNSMRLDLVMAGIVVIGLAGLALDKAVGQLEKRINRVWGRAEH
ncbi:sulfonate ABC transporter permease [Ammoniphilus oxalaticus]|uniref:Sulfonate ABC transporter permease n=1 Tax=Ammoniphilus oxalaticus TaxID=66863 RepID=A0A419SKE2_9BACL|nr:ABC transporter permease [Ammoniphilus oxalaticus]RKD24447.1 sulfonate ABC transporter permease [Ammoniphilus oxalaticus]